MAALLWYCTLPSPSPSQKVTHVCTKRNLGSMKRPVRWPASWEKLWGLWSFVLTFLKLKVKIAEAGTVGKWAGQGRLYLGKQENPRRNGLTGSCTVLSFFLESCLLQGQPKGRVFQNCCKYIYLLKFCKAPGPKSKAKVGLPTPAPEPRLSQLGQNSCK